MPWSCSSFKTMMHSPFYVSGEFTSSMLVNDGIIVGLPDGNAVWPINDKSQFWAVLMVEITICCPKDVNHTCFPC